MIQTHSVYRPLYEDKEKFIILVTGGRGSGKSFSTSCFIERLTFELGNVAAKKIAHQILYTRYTMVSASISVIPEFMEKIEADGTEKYFHKTKTDVINVSTGSHVMFRGIQTSSGNQTAKLKSIHGITTFVVDEAEEWTSEQEFDTIMLSIRQQGLQNRIMIIMNPTDSNHFIYQKYIKDTHKIVEYDGVPVQISTHPNVLHIHTTYLDNIKHLSKQFLDEVTLMKQQNPEKYAHIVMGQWADVAEGAIFKKWGICEAFPSNAKNVGRGLDFGFACFTGDTLICTKRGDIQISEVTENDYVLTRQGYRKVVKVLPRGKKKVINSIIKVNGRDIRMSATEDHMFLVNGKWKKYGLLTKRDKLCILSPSTERPSRGIQVVSTLNTMFTSIGKMASIIVSCCTTKCTKRLLERYHTNMSYITKMAIRSITTLQTLWQSQYQNMPKFMTICGNTGQRNISKKDGTARKIGKSVGLKFLKDLKTKNVFVNRVVRYFAQLTHISGSVTKNVITNINTTQANFLQSLNANGAEKCSGETNTLNPNVAMTNVRMSYRGITGCIQTGESEEEVYDLSIDGVHEYFANGILVHNCDPSACVKFGEVWTQDGVDLYLDEQFYERGMLISDLIRELKKDNTFVYADSADPRLIEEIALGGVIIYGVQKGAGSIVAGIEKMKDYRHLYVTKRSINLQEELRNYVWEKDRNGNLTNQPIDAYNHAVDAARYGVAGKIMGKVIRNEMKQHNGNSGSARPVAFSLN